MTASIAEIMDQIATASVKSELERAARSLLTYVQNLAQGVLAFMPDHEREDVVSSVTVVLLQRARLGRASEPLSQNYVAVMLRNRWIDEYRRRPEREERRGDALALVVEPIDLREAPTLEQLIAAVKKALAAIIARAIALRLPRYRERLAADIDCLIDWVAGAASNEEAMRRYDVGSEEAFYKRNERAREALEEGLTSLLEAGEIPRHDEDYYRTILAQLRRRQIEASADVKDPEEV